MLSDRELHHYSTFGYVVPELRLDEHDVREIQELTLQLIATSPDVRAAVRRPHISDSSALDVTEVRPRWMRIATRPEILDIVEQLIGPDVILWTSTLFYKAPMEAGTPWHRDRCPFLSQLEDGPIITVWIAVFDVSSEEGALRVVPGSQSKSPDADLHFGRLELEPSVSAAAVDVQLSAGEMIVFDASLIHGSFPNVTRRERYGYSLRYFSGSSRFDAGERAAVRARELVLVRGIDRAGNIPWRKLVSQVTQLERRASFDWSPD